MLPGCQQLRVAPPDTFHHGRQGTLQHTPPVYGLTKYRFTEAKRHCLAYGRGAPVQSVRAARTDAATAQIVHFIAFITSSHIVQDLPFGERSITLSNEETIKIPNFIRMMIPEMVVK